MLRSNFYAESRVERARREKPRWKRERTMATRETEREIELLIPVSSILENEGSPLFPLSSSSSTFSSPRHSGTEAFSKVIRSWASRKFMSGCIILFPMAITFYATWAFIHFVDFFSPIYDHLGINVFGLGFITSITFIFLVGIFTSSWLGASVLGVGEWFIKKMPFVSYIYSALKQISAAISPDQTTKAFKEVAIIKHPRIGEYAFGFITSTVVLQRSAGEEELCSVYVPCNHLYYGDVILISSKDIMKPLLTVQQLIEIVVSGGMSIPQILTTIDAQAIQEAKIGNFEA